MGRERVSKTSNGLSFKCPGCGGTHSIPTEGPQAWGWNGSLDKPTITPSIDVKSGHYASSWKPGDACWCDKDYGIKCYRCHSIITDGKIAFCTDSSHALAGQEIELPAGVIA